MRDSIAFIGGGNMARSLIGGLLSSGSNPDNIWVAEPDAGHRELLRGRFGVHTGADNREIAARATLVVLAVKPQVLRPVAEELAATVQAHQPLVLSIAAGVREPDLRRWLGAETAIVRTMPNTPALVGSGATALFANPRVSEVQRQLAESVMRSVGLTVWVEQERMLDAVTALSGSGPAYFFLLIEAMTAAGEKLGLPRATAAQLTLHTALGAARMATESDVEAAELRRRVTSPNGTTEAAIKTFQAGGFEALVQQALDAAARRSAELAEQLGQ